MTHPDTHPDLSTNILALLTMAEEPTPWLIEEWLIQSEMAMIHGPAHVGKTYLVLDLALHIAYGEPDWRGFPIHGGKRPVLYVPSEGRRGIARRLGSWLKVHDPDLFTRAVEHFAPTFGGFTTDDEGDVVEVWEAGEPNLPFEQYNGTPLFPLLLDHSEEGEKSVKVLGLRVQQLAEEHGKAPLVIFDVVGDFAYTSDENSRDFGHAIAMLKPERLTPEGDATVIVVHHEGWSGTAKGRPRGHSSIDGMLDARFALDAETHRDENEIVRQTLIKMTNPKQRNEDQAQSIILELSKPSEEIQNPVITKRLEPKLERLVLSEWGKAKAFGYDPERPHQLSEAESDYVRAVRIIAEENPNDSTALPKELRANLGIEKGTEHDRRKRLVGKGFLAKDTTRGQGGVKLTRDGEAAVVL
jgi:hypothetical protein